MKQFIKMNFRFFKITLLIALVVTLLVLLLNLVQTTFAVADILNTEIILTVFCYALVLSLLNYGFFRILNSTYDWSSQAGKLFLYGVIGSIVLTLIGYAFCRFVQLVWIEQVKTARQFLAEEHLGNYVFPFLIVLVISFFMHALYFYKALQDTKLKKQKRIAGSASAQFDALKNQLDPHFLFNNLNVLTALIEEDPERAQEFTTGLSRIYRYVLAQKEKDLVPLTDELQFAKTYINLLKMRFENSIACAFPTPADDTEGYIVPLSLQLVLENAVKHNAFSEDRPLFIRLELTNGTVAISNRLHPKQERTADSGLGLTNIKRRYALLTKREVGIEKTEKGFCVILPILDRENLLSKEQLWQKEHRKTRRRTIEDRVRQEKFFWIDLWAFLIVIPLLSAFNLYQIYVLNTDFLWVVFPLLGWATGLGMHAIIAYRHRPVFGRHWQNHKIQNTMNISNHNTTNNFHEQRYRDAQKHVQGISDFYKHCILYIIVIGFLAGLNYVDNRFTYAWFLWPAGGWAVGLAFKAANTFQMHSRLYKNWEKRKVEQYMNEEDDTV